jgi:predicted nucleotidyltransferase
MASDGLDRYRDTCRRRDATAREEAACRRHEAWQAARRSAEWLRTTYESVHRVVVFGSVVANQRLGPRSDVDLAVWGLAPDQYFEAVARVQDIATPFAVDLVRVEQVPGALRSTIEQQGTAL